MVLRGGNVTSPLHESRLHWIHDPNPNQSHRVKPKQTVPRNNNNTVPRNNVVRNSDSLSRNPLDPIPSASWYNSSLSVPSASSPRNSVYVHSRSVPGLTKRIPVPTRCLTVLSALPHPLRKGGPEREE